MVSFSSFNSKGVNSLIGLESFPLQPSSECWFNQLPGAVTGRSTYDRDRRGPHLYFNGL
jgi:hypothetical protein